MQKSVKIFAMTAALMIVPSLTASVFAGWYLPRFNPHRWHKDKAGSVQLGPRPFYLVDDMEKSNLKNTLENKGSHAKLYSPFR